MKYVITLLLIAATYPLFAQNAITIERNLFRPGDRITRQQVEYVDPGVSGQNITWDFSRLELIDDKYRVSFSRRSRNDSSRFVVHEHNTRYRYFLNNDTLWFEDFQNRTAAMQYHQPEVFMVFPLRYGDQITSEFAGTGMYSNTVDQISNGNTTIRIDATGEIITPNRQTIKNVIRLHRTREYTEIASDSTQIKYEMYSWYALGYRYPIFETHSTLIYSNDSITEGFNTSFFYPLEDMYELAPDPANDPLRTEEELVSGIHAVFTEASYLPNPVESTLTISYKLTRPANVRFSVHNNIGVPACSSAMLTQSEGHHHTQINMSHLITGTYTLYVFVDDMVLKTNVIKK